MKSQLRQTWNTFYNKQNKENVRSVFVDKLCKNIFKKKENIQEWLDVVLGKLFVLLSEAATQSCS